MNWSNVELTGATWSELQQRGVNEVSKRQQEDLKPDSLDGV